MPAKKNSIPRRDFLKCSTVATVAGVMGSTLLPHHASATETGIRRPCSPYEFEAVHFKAHLGDQFIVERTSFERRSVTATLVLESIQEYSPVLRRNRPANVRQRPFVLVFVARESTSKLESISYRIRHSRLGRFDQLLVPDRNSAEGRGRIRYVAVFG